MSARPIGRLGFAGVAESLGGDLRAARDPPRSNPAHGAIGLRGAPIDGRDINVRGVSLATDAMQEDNRIGHAIKERPNDKTAADYLAMFVKRLGSVGILRI